MGVVHVRGWWSREKGGRVIILSSLQLLSTLEDSVMAEPFVADIQVPDQAHFVSESCSSRPDRDISPAPPTKPCRYALNYHV